jgi:haloalkane dehalogenase
LAFKAIAYMRAIVGPWAWEQWPDLVPVLFRAFRSPKGEELVLTSNVFVEQVLPGSVLRRLSDEEMAQYRKPYTVVPLSAHAASPTATEPRPGT